MADVRSQTEAPTAEEFASKGFTPLLARTSPGNERIYILNDDNTIVPMGINVDEVAVKDEDETITGLWTFDRDPSAPFTVTASSAVVTNLDADMVDGQHRILTINADHTHQSTGAMGGTLDHGAALTGLSDDDHPQYSGIAQTETITGAWTFNTNVAAAASVTFDGVDISAHAAGTAASQHTAGVGTHTHQSAGAQGGTLDHGLALTGLTDDDHTQYLLASGTRALTADWDAGSFEIRAQTLESDVTTGTAPLTIASTTLVSNLNADQVDGFHAASFIQDYLRDVTSSEVVNTASETTVFTSTVTGGDLGTDGCLKLVGVGDYLNNSGADRDFTIRVTYGGTTFGTWTFSPVTASATRRPLIWAIIISAQNSATVQVAGGMATIGSAAGVTGQSASVTSAVSAHTSGSISSGSNQTLAVTFQHSAANASLSAICHAVHVERTA